MNLFRLTPVVLSLLMLAAHFYRAQLPLLAAACLLLPVLMLMRQPWVPRIFQLLLVLGAVEWLRTLYGLAMMRIAFEMPWVRMGLILSGVAMLTLLSAAVFETRALKLRYRGTPSSTPR